MRRPSRETIVTTVGATIVGSVSLLAGLDELGWLPQFGAEPGWSQDYASKIGGRWCTDAYAPNYPDTRIDIRIAESGVTFAQNGYGSGVDHGPVAVVPVHRNGRSYFRYPESERSLTSLDLAGNGQVHRIRWERGPDDVWKAAGDADIYTRC